VDDDTNVAWLKPVVGNRDRKKPHCHVPGSCDKRTHSRSPDLESVPGSEAQIRPPWFFGVFPHCHWC
jgi:hypothetical protein